MTDTLTAGNFVGREAGYNDRLGRLPGMDILKIYAIIMVVLTHCFSESFRAALAPELWIDAAVPVFIIIGAFNYCRKAYKSGLSSYGEWYSRFNFLSYFKRIGVPYIVFMCVQLVVLPLVGYAPLPEVLLNTLKGGMGAGGYYLVVFFQLFLLVPVFYFAMRRHPVAALCVAFALRIAFGSLCERVLIPVNPYIFEGVDKLLSVRFFVCIACGMFSFMHFDKFTPMKIAAVLLAGFVISFVKFFIGDVGVAEIDLAFMTVQQALWCTGLTVLLLHGVYAEKGSARHKAIAFVAGSTLHILLFQQIYFCAVGVGRHLPQTDLPAALLGGFAVYVLWVLAEKKILPLLKTLAKRAKIS